MACDRHGRCFRYEMSLANAWHCWVAERLIDRAIRSCAHIQSYSHTGCRTPVTTYNPYEWHATYNVALLCLALPCLALPCLALPCLALPCLALPCLALPCAAPLWLHT
jgi:hypothetical protein